MTEDNGQALQSAIHALMRPFARILLRCGWTYHDVAKILKIAFVDAATEGYGERGRPANISRVAVLTGLSRKEVARLRKNSGPDVSTFGQGPATQVLQVWHTSAEYLDSSGLPLPLPYSGPEKSFLSLVRQVGGDIPAGAIRAELLRSGAMVERGSGELYPVKRHFIPGDSNSKLVEAIGLGLRTLMETVYHNVAKKSGVGLRFQRVVYCRDIPESTIDDVRKALGNRLTQVTHELDDYLLSKSDADAFHADAGRFAVGVGIHYIEERAEKFPSAS